MRITNGMMHSTYMADLQNNLQRLYTAQMQQSTGKRIQRLSDDPVGLIAGLNARQQLSRIEQFQRNITDSKRWLESSELTMRDMSQVAMDAYELAVKCASDTEPGEVRASASAPQARALLEHLISLANGTTSDEYTFGGFNTKRELPITQATADQIGDTVYDTHGNVVYAPDASIAVIEEGDWLYNGRPLRTFTGMEEVQEEREANSLEFQIGYGLNLPVTMTAPEVLVYQGTDDNNGVTKDLITTLQDFCELLETGTATSQQIQDYISEFQDAQTHIDSAVSTMGGRWNRVAMMEDRYGKDELMYTSIKSTLEDIDIAEAIMNFSMTQSVYNASLQVGSRVIQPTLLDYLR